MLERLPVALGSGGLLGAEPVGGASGRLAAAQRSSGFHQQGVRLDYQPPTESLVEHLIWHACVRATR